MSENGSPLDVGLLTRTVVISSVVNWIVPVHLRHRSLKDVVFVGDDFIHVKQVKEDRQLKHIYTHSNFPARICAAAAFSIDDDVPKEDDLTNDSPHDEPLPHDALPSQLLVLTLETQAILFLYLARHPSTDRLELRTQTVPLPRWPEPRRQVAHHLAVDPRSRAMAVAAMEGQFILFATKDPAKLRSELQKGEQEWCPVTVEVPVPIAGVIQHIVFLNPQHTQPDHIIFLAVVVERRQSRLVWYDWSYTGTIERLQKHDSQSIASPKCVPNLIIPLAEANFILTYGTEIRLFRDLLSGSVDQFEIGNPADNHPPQSPGITSRLPVWANWCRPMRHFAPTLARDSLYLAREDGEVFAMDITDSRIITSSSIITSRAGSLHCHVSRAFASLGRTDMDPELLAVVGDMSTGRIASIGDWTRLAPSHQTSRNTALDMNLVGLLPNWSSISDTVVTSLATARHERRSHDSLYITGGRQPYAALTEIRKGLDAQIAVFATLEAEDGDDEDAACDDDRDNDHGAVRGMKDVWALHDSTDGNVILLLSTPESTVVLCFSASEEDPIVPAQSTAFNTTTPTLAADVLSRGRIVQVTRNSISITTGLFTVFDEHNQTDTTAVLIATIEPEAGLVLCSETKHFQHTLVPYFCDNDDEIDNFLANRGPLPTGTAVQLTARPLALATTIVGDSVFVLVVEDGGLARLLVCQERELHEALSFSVPHRTDNCCESAVILIPPDGQHTAMLKIICGLRDGSIYHCTVRLGSKLQETDTRILAFGQSPVKIARHSSMPHEALAFSGVDTCLLSFDSNNVADISIQSIWLTDKNRPDLSQGEILGFSRMPSPDRLPNSRVLKPAGGHLVLLSSSELSFVDLAREITTVPRQIELAGSPSRLLYAKSHKCWVSAASLCFTRTIDGEELRQARPVIEFISSRKPSRRKEFLMQPGEKVYALLEWTHTTPDDKLHSYILVGGSTRDEKGKIHFLRPDMGNDGAVLDPPRLQFASPVYALALFDELTLVVCHDNTVSVHRFDFTRRKWQQICKPFDGTDQANCVSCKGPHIHITTIRDGMMTLEVRELNESMDSVTHELVPVSLATRAAIGISHLVTSFGGEAGQELGLMTTKEQSLVGYLLPSAHPTGLQYPQTMSTLFEASMKQSVVRIRSGKLRPSWKGKLPQGVLADNIVGTCADGSVLGMLVIDCKLWRRLFWLQRLCEWSSNTLDVHDRYTTAKSDVLGEADELPIGLSEAGSNITLYSPYSRADRKRNKHIDGDMLASIFDDGGIEAVQMMITKAAEREDDVGLWLRNHLAEERAAVAGCLAELSLLLDAWL